MNLAHLRYFAKLAELQHYARASKELYISQPSLTHAIKALEAELGVPLFRRVGRGVELTEFGVKFNECVLRGLRELDRGVDLAREYTDRLSGTVRIGAIYTVQGDYLPRLIKDYRGAYGSGVDFVMGQGLTLPLLDRLEADEFDIAFTALAPNRPNLCFEYVIAHELVVCVSKEHHLAKHVSLTLADLRGYEIHCYRRGAPIAEEIFDLTNGLGLNMVASYEDEISLGGVLSNNPMICGLGTLTIGLRCFPDLVTIPLRDVPREFHKIYLVYKRDKMFSRATESFIEFVHDYVPPEGCAPRTALGGSEGEGKVRQQRL